MVDILLIQPPIRDFYLTAKRTQPYGLACIAGALIRKGFTTEIFDALATRKSKTLNWPYEMAYLDKFYGRADHSPFALFHRYRHFGYSFEHIGKIALDSGAFLVGISSLFTAYQNEAIKTAEIVKKWHPSAKIVLGGHHPTVFPKEVMESRAVDFIIGGEGEGALPHLAQALKTGQGLKGIPGLVFRDENDHVSISTATGEADLDQAPLPALHLVKQAFYQRGGHGSAVIVASRGCPLQCSYCSLGAGSPVKYRRRSVASVIAEIEYAVSHHDARFIDFEDENLSLDKQWFLHLLSEISRRYVCKGLELRAMNGLLPISLDDEMIVAMKAAGFKTLNLSLGSTSGKQLKKFNRPDVRTGFETALELAETHSLGAVGYVIAGAPGQSAEGSLNDLLYLASRRVLAGLSIFYPAPGSTDYKWCKQLGILPDHFSLLRSSCLPVSHETRRTESVTLLRIARILNFMKALRDRGVPLPMPESFADQITLNPSDREEAGLKLLSWFLKDGSIRGVTPKGDIYTHQIDRRLTDMFLDGISRITVRGSIR